MAILKFKDENNQWQDLVALRGRDGVIQYQAGAGIIIDGNVISAIQQDLSNYYTKAQVNDLIDAIDKVSLEAVNELPATGEPGIIYLVPSANPQTTNAKDEYIYINNAWEQIGTTAVDLSNYYTKSEVDNKVITTLTENTTLTKYGVYNVATDINRGITVTGIASGNYYTINLYGEGTLIYAGNKNYSQTQWTDVFFYFCTAWNEPTIYYWKDAVRKEFKLNNYLPKDNTTSYTPTSNYHPATKKYVDDAVAGAGGSGNANINYYTLTSNVDITNVTSDLTYSEPNKTNVELNDTYTEMATIINKAYQDGVESIGIILLDKKWNIPFINCNLLRGALGIQSKPTTMYLSAPYVSTYGLSGINQDNAATIVMPRLTITMSWTGDVCTVTGVKYIWTLINIPSLGYVLTKDNTTSYTPTGNYHPATKKYVDDKIPGVATTSTNGLMSAADKTSLNDLVTAVGSVSSTDVTNWNNAATNSHTHANKTLLDTITSGDVSDWNDAVTNSHTHANKTVLDGITAANVTAWNKTHIYSGTSTPGAGTGENGDIYVKYTA